MTTQQTEKNISLLRRLFDEVLAKGDLSNYEEFVAADVLAHCPPSWKEVHENEIRGISDIKEIDKAYSKAFKLSKVTIQDIIANQGSGEKIVVRWSFEGTHVADYFGVKATHKPFNLSGVSIYRFNAEGKIVEVWQSWDMLGLLQQIGALKIVM